MDDNSAVYIDVYADERDETFPAWVDPDYRWNGAAIPSFSREVAQRVVAWTNRLHAEMPDGACTAWWEGDKVWMHDPQLGEEEPPLCVCPDEDGRYGIGATYWTWLEVE